MHKLKIIVITLLVLVGESYAQIKNGFNLNNTTIPVGQIEQGGSPRDGIPALISPASIRADETDYLDPNDRVLGVSMGEIARAYPIAILNWHEVVNDHFDNQHFVVTYCPLCGTGMVFAANVANTALRFGVSGLLYNSDVLLYDLTTESLWSQILRRSISGPLVNTELPQLPARHTTWAAWKQAYPHTSVLSPVTGYNRQYKQSPYRGYERSRDVYFQVIAEAPRTYHPKALVLGIDIDGKRKVYPFEELAANDKASFQDEFNGQSLTIRWDSTASSAVALDPLGKELPVTISYWFAWYAFFPNSTVFSASTD